MMLSSDCFGGASRYIPQEKLSLLKQNQTTKAEIIKLIGNPFQTTNDTVSNSETLIYDNCKMCFMSDKMTRQTVNLLIDNAGILKKISVNERIEDFKSYSQFIAKEKLALLKSKENQFTKTEVINLIGSPSWTYFGSGGRGEIYMYYHYKMGSKRLDNQTVCLFIDDAGILKKICVNDKSTPVRKKRGDAVSFATSAAFHGLIPAAVVWLISDSYEFGGESFAPEKLALLKENKTTKTEIAQLIGKPDWNAPGEDGKGEYYCYYFLNEKKYQGITLYIDDTDILQKISLTEKD